MAVSMLKHYQFSFIIPLELLLFVCFNTAEKELVIMLSFHLYHLYLPCLLSDKLSEYSLSYEEIQLCLIKNIM